MAFTQLIIIGGADEQALKDHVTAWDDAQAGVAPGYLGARVFADQDRPGRYLIEVDFRSEEDARRNSDRPETQAWAEQLRNLGTGDPEFGNLRQVGSTYA